MSRQGKTGVGSGINKRSGRHLSQLKKAALGVVEPLEARIFLNSTSALDNYSIPAQLSQAVEMPQLYLADGQISPSTLWLTPSALSSWYGFNNVSDSGSGETIAIIDWGNDPNIGSDLSAFDSEYGISSSTLNVYAQNGEGGNFESVSTPGISLPENASNFYSGNIYNSEDLEISLDVETAHALAPAATIDLVEAYEDSDADIDSAINYVNTTLTAVSVVSMSFAQSEVFSADEPLSDSLFTATGVSYVASTGDQGSYGVEYGANTFSAGGTGINGTTDSYTTDDAILVGGSNAFTLATQVASSTTADHAGISIRESASDDSSPEVSILLSSSGTVSFRYRNTEGGATTIDNEGTASEGSYLELARQGTSYFAYTSTDGVTWTSAGSVNISAMSGTVTPELVATGTGTFTYSAGTLVAVSANSPATSSNVVAVGGTMPATSITNGTAAIASENTAWGNGTLSYTEGGSGGGYSIFESTPAWQDGVNSSGNRSVPDVAFDAGTSVVIYDSDNLSSGGGSAWFPVVGTSIGAPAWSAIFAIADQMRGTVGLPSLNSTSTVGANDTQSLLYSLPTTGTQAALNDDFSGSNGAYSASNGYNLVTGLGTPDVQYLVPDLAAPEIVSGTTLTITAGSSGSTIVGTGNSSLLTVTFTPTGGSATTRVYTDIDSIIAYGGGGNDSIDMGGVTGIACDLVGGADTLAGVGGDSFATSSGCDIYIGGGTESLANVSLGGATLIIDSGATLDLDGQTSDPGTLFLAGTLVNSSATAANWEGPVTLSGTPSVAGADNLTISGVISGSGSLTKGGSGMLTLSGSNSFTGGTTVESATLQLGNEYALGTSSVTVDSGTEIDLNGQTVSSSNELYLAGGYLTNSDTGALATWSGSIDLTVTLPPRTSPAGMLGFRRFQREQGHVEQASHIGADHLQAA
jgi:autotransporter-associated beta strand protein